MKTDWKKINRGGNGGQNSQYMLQLKQAECHCLSVCLDLLAGLGSYAAMVETGRNISKTSVEYISQRNTWRNDEICT